MPAYSTVTYGWCRRSTVLFSRSIRLCRSASVKLPWERARSAFSCGCARLPSTPMLLDPRSKRTPLVATPTHSRLPSASVRSRESVLAEKGKPTWQYSDVKRTWKYGIPMAVRSSATTSDRRDHSHVQYGRRRIGRGLGGLRPGRLGGMGSRSTHGSATC